MGAIFILSFCRAPEHQYLPEESACTQLVSRYLQLRPAASPRSPRCGGQEAGVPGSRGTVTIGITQEEAPIPLWHQDFCSCCQETLTWPGSRGQQGLLAGPTGSQPREKEFLHSYHSRTLREAADPGAWPSCEGGLLADRQGFGLHLWSRLLINQISKGCRPFPETSERGPSARFSLTASLSSALQYASVSWRGALIHVWCPVFCGSHPGTPLHCHSLGARGTCLLSPEWLYQSQTILDRLPSLGHWVQTGD